MAKRRNAPYPLDDLEREVRAMPIEDEHDLVAFLPLASRLAALGRPDPLARWTPASRPFAERVTPALVDRTDQGVWDLEHALGEDLGLAVISAQDYACFLALGGDDIEAPAR